MTVEERIAEHGAWARGIARSMMRKLPPSFDVEDMMQCALIGLWKAAERFDEAQGVPFLAWAHTFVQGECWMAVRRRSYVEAMHAEIPESAVSPVRTDEQVELAMEMEGLRRAFRLLKPRSRKIAEMVWLDGNSLARVAACVGVSETTIRTRLADIRKELRDACGKS